MRTRLFIMALLLSTMATILWSVSYADDTDMSGGASNQDPATDPKSTQTSDKDSKKLDNGPQVKPKDPIQQVEATQPREPIAPRP